MWLVNLFLNFIGLCCWFAWLGRIAPPPVPTGVTLAITLKPAGGRRTARLWLPAALLVLLFARAWFYCDASPVANWTPKLNWEVVVIPFRGGNPASELMFSFLSFAACLAVIYFSLVLLSVANYRMPENDPIHQLVRLQLAAAIRVPAPVRLLLPFLAATAAWLAIHPLLVRLQVVPTSTSILQLVRQACVIGVGSYLSWKYLLLGVLLVNLVGNYVYLGNHPVWNYIDATARNLLAPLRWLPFRAGRVDFLAPLVFIIVAVLTWFAAHPPLSVTNLLAKLLAF